MKIFSLLKRFAQAEAMAIAFFLALEGLAYGAVHVVRHFDPDAGDAYLVNIDFFWKLMALSGMIVAVVLGGPCHLLCARFMSSRRLPYWIAGGVIALGGGLLFAVVLGDALGSDC
ncbi:MAG TPA: hypothetical protein VF798_06890 [Burkholderiaceae bacterium]